MTDVVEREDGLLFYFSSLDRILLMDTNLAERIPCKNLRAQIEDWQA